MRDQYIDEQSLKELNQQLNYARTRLKEDARSRFQQLQRARASSPDIGMLTATLNSPTLTNLRAPQAAVLNKSPNWRPNSAQCIQALKTRKRAKMNSIG